MKLSTRFCGATFLFMISGVAAIWADTTPTVLYVNKANQTGLENGLSWATAFSTIQPAIDAAAGQSDAQVWVQAGVYDEERHGTWATQDPSDCGSLMLAATVKLYGGFVGSELSVLERAAGMYSTIDGSHSRSGTNAYPVVVGTTGADIDGFIITGGKTKPAPVGLYPQAGGGLVILNGDVNVSNCIFRDNVATRGGAVYFAYGAGLRMKDCTFEGNRYQDYGESAISNSSFGNISLEGCTFRHNARDASVSGARADGYVVSLGGTNTEVKVERCKFEDNTDGLLRSGGVDLVISQCQFARNTGPLLYCNLNNSVAISQSSFEDNEGSISITAKENIPLDGCSFLRNGTLGTISGYKDVSLLQCDFVGNGGDGLLCGGTNVSIAECTFTDNAGSTLTCGPSNVSVTKSVFLRNGSPTASFGAYSSAATSQTITNCLFAGNTGQYAGAVYLPYVNCTASVDSCTFAGNVGENGGVVYAANGALCRFRRSILWGNSTPVAATDISGVCEATYCDVEGGFPGEGNIDNNPKFKNPEQDDYQLSWGSPCIDAGDATDAPADDIEGVARPQLNGPDLGAYEVGFNDGDNDGMDDAWEVDNGLNPLDGSDGALDLDGDGMSNLAEYLVRSDPQDPQDPLSVIYVSTTGDDSAGNGAEYAPFGTIGTAMIMAAQYSMYRAATIYLGPGEFDEPVHMAPFVTLAGVGPGQTTIQYHSASDDEHVVVTGAEGAALRDCTVTLPDFYAVSNLLFRLSDAAMTIDNVVFDGNDNLYSLGALITGPGTSQSVIRDCVFRRLHFGVQAVNSGVNITETLFEGIRGDAVFIRLPDGYKSGSILTPLLGDAALTDATGHNQFRTVMGALVVNMSPESTRAENNDWGYYNKEEIQSHVMGSVDYEPFICNGPCTGEGEGEGESEGEGEGEGEQHGLWDCFGAQ